MPNGTQPSLLNTSYTITAEIGVPQGGADGMIINEGGRRQRLFGGRLRQRDA
jgi:arylsulfatase